MGTFLATPPTHTSSLLPGPYHRQQQHTPICSLFSPPSLSPPPPLLLPWEELFLGAASWDVLLGAGYHEGNVIKIVGKG